MKQRRQPEGERVIASAIRLGASERAKIDNARDLLAGDGQVESLNNFIVEGAMQRAGRVISAHKRKQKGT